jgi:hypothetical protein
MKKIVNLMRILMFEDQNLIYGSVEKSPIYKFLTFLEINLQKSKKI